MKTLKLSATEKKWLSDLDKLLANAPKSLRRKGVRSYTIGDRDVMIYDGEKCDRHVEDSRSFEVNDVCKDVRASESLLHTISFPFVVESTAG